MGRKLTKEDDNLIAILYLEENKSSVEIGKLLGTSHRSVLNHLEKMGIQRRSLEQSQFAHNNKSYPKELLDRNIMYDLYINKHYTKEQLGKRFNCAPHVIDRVLRKFNIPVRDNSQSKIGVQRGECHHNWKGGITPLYKRCREFYSTNLAQLVRERDRFCCQMCGSKEEIQVHHVVNFKDILSQILMENSDLDPQKDLEQLYAIIINDERFLSLDNLITLCKECHLYKVHHYIKTISIQSSQEEGSTTIPQGSTPQAIGGGSGEHPETDEDIV